MYLSYTPSQGVIYSGQDEDQEINSSVRKFKVDWY